MTYAEFLKTLEADIEKMKKANFSEDEINIVDTWYNIEYEEPDISTERLIQMVCDELDVDYEDVTSTMCKFAELGETNVHSDTKN